MNKKRIIITKVGQPGQSGSLTHFMSVTSYIKRTFKSGSLNPPGEKGKTHIQGRCHEK